MPSNRDKTELKPTKLLTRTNTVIIGTIIAILVAGVAYESIQYLTHPSPVTVEGMITCGADKACNGYHAPATVTFANANGEWTADVNNDGSFVISLPNKQTFSVVGETSVQQGTVSCNPFNNACSVTGPITQLYCNAGNFTLDSAFQTYTYFGTCNAYD